MATPSGALNGFAFHYLVTGHGWEPFVNDQSEDESTLGSEENIEISAPLIMMWVDEGRTVNGQALEYSSTGLEHFTDSSPADFTAHRWARVVKRPADADNTVAWDGPIVQSGDGTDDNETAWFEVRSWGEALPEGSWGGAEVNITVHDPQGIYANHFTAGRSVSIYVEEYEDDSLHSATELFSGFVLRSANTSGGVGTKQYTFTAGTIDRLFATKGKDGGAALFIQEDFSEGIGVYQPGQGYVPPTEGLIASNFAHIFFQLTPGRVIAHLMLWHMYARVDGDTYRLAQLVNFRRDYWNDPSASLMYIPILALAPGNIMQQLARLLPQGVFCGYSARTSDFTVAAQDEFKATPDTPVDSIDEDTAYSIEYLPGENDTIGQVMVAQTPSLHFDRTQPPKIYLYPSSAVPNRSIHQVEDPILVITDEGGELLCSAIYDRLNSQDRVRVHVRGATFSLHNKLTLDGDQWSVEQVEHQFDAENLGSHETIVVARRVGG